MEFESSSENLRRLLAILGKWAWLLGIVAAAAGGLAYVVSANQPPVYAASTLVLIEVPDTNAIDYNAVLTSERLAKTYAERMITRPVLAGVLQKLQRTTDTLPVEEFREAITVQPLKDTQLIEVRVEAHDPGLAARLANSLVAEFSARDQERQAARFAASKKNLEAQLDQLDRQIQAASGAIDRLGESADEQAERDRLEGSLAQYRQAYAALLQSYEGVRLAEAQTASLVVQEEAAVPPARPVRPRVLANTLLAGLLGLLLAGGGIFLIETLDDSLRDPEDIPRRLGLPILAIIAHHDGNGGQPLSAVQPRAPAAEAFRGLRTNLDFASVDHPLRTLMVASPTPQDGKSTVAANLAVVLAQAERRVVLVDSDLRRPVQHKKFERPNSRGLSGLFLQAKNAPQGGPALRSFIQSTGIPCLSLLSAGELPPNPAELLGSRHLPAILEWLLGEAEIVLFDSPPVLAVTDAVVLAPRLDGVVLVIKPGVTKLAACRQAVEQLRRVGANLLGVVVNDVPLKRGRYSYYRYHSPDYSYRETPEARRWMEVGRNWKPGRKTKAPGAPAAAPGTPAAHE